MSEQNFGGTSALVEMTYLENYEFIQGPPDGTK
jgi:hypothetical protein